MSIYQQQEQQQELAILSEKTPISFIDLCPSDRPLSDVRQIKQLRSKTIQDEIVQSRVST